MNVRKTTMANDAANPTLATTVNKSTVKQPEYTWDPAANWSLDAEGHPMDYIHKSSHPMIFCVHTHRYDMQLNINTSLCLIIGMFCKQDWFCKNMFLDPGSKTSVDDRRLVAQAHNYYHVCMQWLLSHIAYSAQHSCLVGSRTNIAGSRSTIIIRVWNTYLSC